MNNFKELIELWPSRAEFARDLGVKEVSGRKMWDRDSVSSKHFLTILEAAKKRNFTNITAELLIKLSHQEEPVT